MTSEISSGSNSCRLRSCRGVYHGKLKMKEVGSPGWGTILAGAVVNAAGGQASQAHTSATDSPSDSSTDSSEDSSTLFGLH
jgi:hypothetical protein